MHRFSRSWSRIAGFAAVAAAFPATLLAAVPDDDRITALVLSSGGVAQVERSVRLLDEATLELAVPLDQVDDILKSLVVRDPQGPVAHAVLDGDAPVRESFARLPFGPEALASPARLAAALPGAAVRATSGGRTVQGSVLGVETPAPSDSGAEAPPLLSVMTDAGQVQVLRLGPDTVLDLLDEPLRQRIQAALQASRQQQSGTMRTLVLALDGKGTRDVGLTYVVAAPVWKSAYRLLAGNDGKARLQGWAVLENATGQDWKNVDVTLESGAPVVLSQRLSERYWNPRPELPVAVGAVAPPRVDTAVLQSYGASGGAGQSRVARQVASRPMPPPAPAPMMMAEADRLEASALPAATAREGQVSVRYDLPKPVSATAGQIVTVPFLDAALPAELISVFQPDRGGSHPVAAAWVRNDTGGSLPPGILTVYDEASGHVGDAQLPAVPAGDSRLVYFAEDRKVDIRAEQQPQERVSELKVSQGVLEARRQLQHDTVYTVRGAADAPRTVIIEHPRQAGWQFASPALDGETATHYRLKVVVPAGATATVKATATRTERQEMALLDTDADHLLRWSTTAADDATRKTLAELAERRRALAVAERREATLQERVEQAVTAQERIRANLAAVPADSALGQRYLAMLATEEDAIATAQREQTQAAEETARRREALEAGLVGSAAGDTKATNPAR